MVGTLWYIFTREGIVVIKGGICELLDMNTKSLGKANSYSAKALEGLVEESELTIGGKMVVLDKPISPEEFESGRMFLSATGDGMPFLSLY
jgi:hypothetical protein